MTKTKRSTLVVLIAILALALVVPTLAYAVANQEQNNTAQKSVTSTQDNSSYANNFADTCRNCIDNCSGYVDADGNGVCDVYESGRSNERLNPEGSTYESNNAKQAQRGNQGQRQYCQSSGCCWQ